MTIRNAVSAAAATLQHSSNSALLDAEVLLAHSLQHSRAHLHAWPDKPLTATEQHRFQQLVEQRKQGIPVAYLTGTREFWSLPLRVTRDTLIPRPDTEFLVEQALARIPADADWEIADLGTGSGAIALAIASERPRCRVVATDINPATLAVAARNATTLALGNVEFVAGDWCAPLASQRFALIISNPPYVRSDDAHLDAGDVRHEPRQALAAGPDGLAAFRLIVTAVRPLLTSPGYLLLEHGFDQRAAVMALLRQQGYTDVHPYPDAGGLDRVIAARLATCNTADPAT